MKQNVFHGAAFFVVPYPFPILARQEFFVSLSNYYYIESIAANLYIMISYRGGMRYGQSTDTGISTGYGSVLDA